MARLFLGLDLPGKLRNRLSEEGDRLRLSGAEVAWVRKEAYHVTVRFLGELDPEELMELDPVLRVATAESSPVRLVAQGLGAFPDPVRPRVVWCGVVGATEEDEGALHGLRDSVDEGLRQSGYRREKSEFQPHVTLGRFRGSHNAAELVTRMGPSARRPFGHFRCADLVLFESFTTRQGTVYNPIQRFSLGS